ncbi:MAG TPA: BlaI/MecI/CopY family transcriptional regulator [Candidatus Brachybacterium merdavium]|uniref:BlaI/MecI/CopY family transcriptional regulator n=1 Tax=Candidatus Brachybacterium merdavium TaxID=2838513 RepID=A0A9D2LFN1_9MICO|nr:BlaI/MecI/CopY family transcriptional regulator [Candidatus Brachybacterium merdavium]
MTRAAASAHHLGPVPLGALERQVMEVLWDDGDLTVRELISALGDVHAYTTIATVLSNLDRKDMVRSRRDGRSVRYSPRHSRSMHAARAMEHALSTSNDRTASILHFVQTMEPDDVELLREYLQQQEPSGRRGTDGRADAAGQGDGS